MSKAQVNPNIWDSLVSVSNEYYSIKVPKCFKRIPTSGEEPEVFFDASGTFLPLTHNYQPVEVYVTLERLFGGYAYNCAFSVERELKINETNKISKKFKTKAKKTKLTSMHKAYFISCRYYRIYKEYNVSEFYIITFSEKAQTCYVYSIMFKYNDKDYLFDKNNNFTEFAKKLFSYFILYD